MEVQVYFDGIYDCGKSVEWSDMTDYPDGLGYQSHIDYYGEIWTLSYIRCQKCNKYTKYGDIMDGGGPISIKYFCTQCRYCYFVCFKHYDLNKESNTVKLCSIYCAHNNDNRVTEKSKTYNIISNDECGELGVYMPDDFTGGVKYLLPTYHFDYFDYYNKTGVEQIHGEDGGYPIYLNCEKCGIIECNDK